MNPQDATYNPTIAALRYLLERAVLSYYQNDNVTLKPYTDWSGYYTLKTGQRIPCIFAEGANLVPSSWKPSGIQCIIRESPEDVRSPGIGQAISVSTWTIIFTNFGFAEGTNIPLTLREIQSRMIRLFSTVNLRYMPRSEVALESLTARIRGSVVSPLLQPY
jgi:hypothetical protein